MWDVRKVETGLHLGCSTHWWFSHSYSCLLFSAHVLLRSHSVQGSVCGSEELSCSPSSGFTLAPIPQPWLRIPRRRRCQIPTVFHTTCNICSALTRLTAASQTAPSTQYHTSLCCIQVNIILFLVFFLNPCEIHWNSTWRRSKDRLWSINCCYALKRSLQTICSATGAAVRWLFLLGSICFSSFIFPFAITMCCTMIMSLNSFFCSINGPNRISKRKRISKTLYMFYEGKNRQSSHVCEFYLRFCRYFSFRCLPLQKTYFTWQELSLHRTFSWHLYIYILENGWIKVSLPMGL